MVYIGRKELNSKYFVVASLTILIAALCILKIGGLAATIAIIIYCILLGLTIFGILEQIFNPKAVGIKIGMVPDLKTGRMSLNMNVYDQFIETYEHRFSSIWFWLDIPITVGWVIIFLLAGHSLITYIVIAAYMGLEIGRYEVYKAVKKNKAVWGAAMYTNEISNFIKEKTKRN